MLPRHEKTPLSVLVHSLLLAGLASQGQAQEGGAAFYEEITIVGDRDAARRITGAAHFIGPDQLEVFSYSDIQRIGREIPGLSVQVEDGFGLRPNISIRGVATERSSRITLLEDNVLVAPAPYAAPAAYYFPTAGRMHAFEVVKGPAAITQGPYTIGGALNMVSTPIPRQREGKLLLEGGEDATWRLHGSYGGFNEAGLGFLLETHQWRSDGYQEIDRSGRDSGLEVEDYTLKLAWAPQQSRHRVELKLQYAGQDSNQSYLGLTDADFAARPYRRYGLSELDNIATQHQQAILRYEFSASDSLRLSATAYSNEHARNWFKTEGIDLDGSPEADALSRTGWAAIIEDINAGASRDGFSPAQLQGILDGTLDTPPGSIDMRANNREYYSRGVQFGLNLEAGTGAWVHNLEAGLRLHRDEEDRLQFDSSFQQLGGRLVRNDVGALGAAGNRVSRAEALALYIHDRIEYGAWTFSPGLRYEDIELERVDYAGGAARQFDGGRGNDVQVWLPGMGVSYRVSGRLSLLGGVHKGFTAPPNSPGVEEEEALNYELGLRYDDGRFNAEAIGFLSDYENLLGICTASSGTGCDIGDAFNGDAATVLGLEVLAGTDLSTSADFSLPLLFTWTWIDAEFDNDIGETEFFGDVGAGDPLPYIPEQQYRLSLGFETARWGLNLGISHVDEVCVRASCGPFERTDESLVLDLAGELRLNPATRLYARIENLGGEEAIVGRQPYGARPNKDRTAVLGLRASF